MKHQFTAAMLAIVTAFASAPFAPAAIAHDSYSHIRSVHIDRQCDRYGDFCGTETKVSTKRTYTRKRVARTKSHKQRSVVTNRTYDEKPFIDRQCTRYGNFC